MDGYTPMSCIVDLLGGWTSELPSNEGPCDVQQQSSTDRANQKHNEGSEMGASTPGQFEMENVNYKDKIKQFCDIRKHTVADLVAVDGSGCQNYIASGRGGALCHTNLTSLLATVKEDAEPPTVYIDTDTKDHKQENYGICLNETTSIHDHCSGIFAENVQRVNSADNKFYSTNTDTKSDVTVLAEVSNTIDSGGRQSHATMFDSRTEFGTSTEEQLLVTSETTSEVNSTHLDISTSFPEPVSLCSSFPLSDPTSPVFRKCALLSRIDSKVSDSSKSHIADTLEPQRPREIMTATTTVSPILPCEENTHMMSVVYKYCSLEKKFPEPPTSNDTAVNTTVTRSTKKSKTTCLICGKCCRTEILLACHLQNHFVQKMHEFPKIAHQRRRGVLHEIILNKGRPSNMSCVQHASTVNDDKLLNENPDCYSDDSWNPSQEEDDDANYDSAHIGDGNGKHLVRSKTGSDANKNSPRTKRPPSTVDKRRKMNSITTSRRHENITTISQQSMSLQNMQGIADENVSVSPRKTVNECISGSSERTVNKTVPTYQLPGFVKFRNNDDGNYMCPLCPEGFISSKRLGYHFSFKHAGTPLPCPVCSKTFKNNMSLSDHAERHGSCRTYLCEICGLFMKSRRHINSHILHSHGTKRFSCDKCSYKTASRSAFRSHTNIHDGVKDNLCQTCGRTFTQLSVLQRHVKIHSTDERHTIMCTVCNVAFTQKWDYNRHLKSSSHIKNNIRRNASTDPNA